MINDLSTLSRAERGIGSEPESIDVASLLQDLYHEYQPKAAARHLALDHIFRPNLARSRQVDSIWKSVAKLLDQCDQIHPEGFDYPDRQAKSS